MQVLSQSVASGHQCPHHMHLILQWYLLLSLDLPVTTSLLYCNNFQNMLQSGETLEPGWGSPRES